MSPLATISSILTSILLTTKTSVADVTPFVNNAQYNAGKYGDYPTQTFKSNPAVTQVPRVNFMKPFTNCDDGSYLFLTPRGHAPDPTLVILDPSGSPIWASTKTYGEVYNLQVQQYKGESFLTFWGGDDTIGGHGEGNYYMLDQGYNQRYRIGAANKLGADLHAFTITKDDTALITIYQAIATDLSSASQWRTRGWIWDSVFQEIDIETGELHFQWRASDHVPITNSYTDMNAATQTDPWDVYHINSVEKDDLGNYLISIRFLRAILYIDGRTGEVLWQLGGKDNSFEDLSDGKATVSLGQHDAHWHNDHRYITYFDNRADWYNQMDDQSRGTRIEVDLERMTARLDQTFTDPNYKILSTSQGSYQTLPNGNVVLGYGFNGVIAEFSPEGELLCDAYLQPASTFTTGNVQSYRNLRFNWTATPSYPPDLVLEGSRLYFSWNGATEVDTWLLVGSDTADETDQPSERAIQDAIVVGRTGFETVYRICKDDGLGQYVRAIALDKNGVALGGTNVVDTGDLATGRGKDYPDYEDSEEYHAQKGQHGGDGDGDGDDDYQYDMHVGEGGNTWAEGEGVDDETEDLEILIGFAVFAVLSAGLVIGLLVCKERWLERRRRAGGPEASQGRVAAWRHKFSGFIARLRRNGRRDDFGEVSAKRGLLEGDSLAMAEAGDHPHPHP
ncbi:Hypothetical predicted protein [Lecanosticta acicola]|uniref:Arylsulfotransferase n=1 Tax=Lecanosticta acicola TaxID=111012 RepID=A0AAI8Z450_9PEZI|nr:Hypothetical predicted protein [Lecanosticta acicola]